MDFPLLLGKCQGERGCQEYSLLGIDPGGDKNSNTVRILFTLNAGRSLCHAQIRTESLEMGVIDPFPPAISPVS
jgi:hypothetical protein